jgi:hypothetical protein
MGQWFTLVWQHFLLNPFHYFITIAWPETLFMDQIIDAIGLVRPGRETNSAEKRWVFDQLILFVGLLRGPWRSWLPVPGGREAFLSTTPPGRPPIPGCETALRLGPAFPGYIRNRQAAGNGLADVDRFFELKSRLRSQPADLTADFRNHAGHQKTVTDPAPKILRPAEPFLKMDRVVISGDVGKPDHILFREGPGDGKRIPNP